MPENIVTINQVIDNAARLRHERGRFGPRENSQFLSAIDTALTARMDGHQDSGIKRVAELFAGFGNPTDRPEAVVERFYQQAVFDTGYLALFKTVDLTRGSSIYWQIATQGEGVTFKKLEAGGEIRASYATTSVDTYSVDYYAAGVEILDQWVENQEWYKIEAVAEDFQRAYMRKKAQTMYGLLDTISSSINVAWDTTGSTTVEKDIITINTAIAAIVAAALTAKEEVAQGEPFVLTAPHALKGRILAALDHMRSNPFAVTAALTTKTKLIDEIVVPVFTSHLSSSTSYYVSRPMRKSQMAIRKELSTEKGRDILKLADVEVRYAAWGGAIADINQHRRCATE